EIVLGEYLNLVIQSSIVQHQIGEIMSKYAAQPGIYLQEVSNLQVILPERIKQESIVADVQNVLRELVSALDVAKSEIALIREYRTRLIADVVTGKLNVRNLASAEPPPADEPTDVGMDGTFDDNEEEYEGEESALVEEEADG